MYVCVFGIGYGDIGERMMNDDDACSKEKLEQ